MSRTQELFAPQWAGGWTLTRWLFVIAALRCHGPRFQGIGDAYGASDMVFVSSVWRLAHLFVMTETLAWSFWVLGLVGIGLVAWGRGAAFYAGLLAWFVGCYGLIGHEALNVKAFDRLLLWVGVGLAFSPAGESGLSLKYRSPLGRWILLLVFCSIYGSTGWFKLLMEPGWWTGETLAFHLVNPHHGGESLGIWMSGQHTLILVMSWWTVIFEAAFPVLIWFRRTNPWVLLMAAGFQVGLFWLMNIPQFFYVTLAAFPVLLHPEVARSLWERVSPPR